MKARKLAYLGLAVAALVLSARGPTWAAAGRAIKPALINPPGTETAPGAGIVGTHHDWSYSGAHPGISYTGINVGLCTYCHTPHKALTTKLLWNQQLSTNVFSWTDATTTEAGTLLPTFTGNGYSGPTAKCLSCHDGLQAVGDYNLFDESGRATANPRNATYHIKGLANIGYLGSMNGNHPVAAPYPQGGVLNIYNRVTNGAGIIFSQWQSTPVAPARLYVDPTGDGSDIRTFNAADNGAGKAGIECSSCHDPHNKLSTGDYFLLGTVNGNDTDYICMKCHIK